MRNLAYTVGTSCSVMLTQTQDNYSRINTYFVKWGKKGLRSDLLNVSVWVSLKVQEKLNTKKCIFLNYVLARGQCERHVKMCPPPLIWEVYNVKKLAKVLLYAYYFLNLNGLKAEQLLCLINQNICNSVFNTFI